MKPSPCSSLCTAEFKTSSSVYLFILKSLAYKIVPGTQQYLAIKNSELGLGHMGCGSCVLTIL